MRIFEVYKMEMYKMFKRKNSLILVIPSLLALLIILGYKSGAVKITSEEALVTAYSCLDFFGVIWSFLSGLGIIGILIILLASFQFSGEVNEGQIKMMVLRVGKREKIIFGKLLSMITMIVISIGLLFIVSTAGYYMFISSSDLGTGTFLGTISEKALIFSLLSTVITLIFLVTITYVIGVNMNMFMTFIITLVVMYVGKYLSGLENLKFMKYTSFFSERLDFLFNDFTNTLFIKGFLGSFLLIACVVFLGIMRFKKVDIR